MASKFEIKSNSLC